MIRLKNHNLFIRLFSNAMLMQAVLSAASMSVGLLLIRRTTDAEYGYYVLITNAVMLLSALQNAYIQPSLVYCLTSQTSDRNTRSNFTGGLYREQRTLLLILATLLVLIASLLWMANVLSRNLFAILVAGAIATVFALFREFYRMVLLAYRLPNNVLGGDTVYAVVLVAGVALATLSPAPAAFSALSLALAALLGGAKLQKSLRHHEMWNVRGNPGALRQIYSVGLWASAGAGVHWAFAQGYNYLVAGTLNVSAVAAISATRTLIMPVNLLSTGIATFMFPTVAGWLQKLSVRVVFRRLLLLSAGLVLASSVYLLGLWTFRDWIFSAILKKHFAQQNLLLGLWFLVGIAMLLRDQLLYIIIAKARFRQLSALTLAGALLSLTTSYFAMRRYGETGALCGLLLGEVVSVAGLIFLSLREANTAIAAPMEDSLCA